MQEEYLYLSKRHLVLQLFYNEINNYRDEWINRDKKLPKCDSSCKVMAKFEDGHEEEVYFCSRAPHWWYVNKNGRNPVITDKITQWHC